MKPGLFNHFISIIDRLDPPQRVRKLSNRDVVECAVYVLRTGVGWRDGRVPPGSSPMTAYGRWKEWAEHGIMDTVWHELLQIYSARQLKTNPQWFKDLFIDTTMIKNVSGVDCTGKNSTDRGRQATKLSVICDQAQIPVAAVFYPANITDVTTTEETVSNIACSVRKDSRYRNTIIGDKGYVSEENTAILKTQDFKLLFPAKRNARKKYRTSKERGQLRRRHRIENLFCRLDKFKRIHVRRDNTIVVFEAMHKLAFSLLIADKLEQMDCD
jgi:transposase